ncbi:MAG: hypothetical protein OEV94_05925 [Deltaproteobacteria bacterium]|nr:hypothetical protein [Deltaproteobacteria bacterium]
MTKKSGGKSQPKRPPKGSNPRIEAARAYTRFLQGQGLPSAPPAAMTQEEDRRFFQNLLSTLVRHRRLLAELTTRFAGRPVDQLDPSVAALAALGLAQLRFLPHIPAHAALFETVEATAALGVGRARGMVNGLLRNAQRKLQGTEAPRWPEEAELPLAVAESYPDWMVNRWQTRLGEEATGNLCREGNRFEGVTLRVETRRIGMEELMTRLGEEGVETFRHPLWSRMLTTTQTGLLIRSQPFRQGLCYIQDASSQVLMGWVSPRMSGRVLDVAAAPGGKLGWLAGLEKGRPWLAGADHDPGRLAMVRENLTRLRLPPAALLAADGRALPFPHRVMNGVVVDAPCSATGQIRKYPELKWQRRLEDLTGYVEKQSVMLAEAGRVTAPGGIVLYITCSLEPEENEDQVEAFLKTHPHFHRVSFGTLPPPEGLNGPGRFITRKGDFQVYPGDHIMGLYAAFLRREG